MSKEKTHILFISPSFKLGGSEKIVYTIAKNLNKDFFKVSVLCLNNDEKAYFLNDDENIQLIEFEIQNVRKSFFSILNTIRSVKPGIVFSSSNHLNTFLTLFCCIFPKIRFVAREPTTVVGINLSSVESFKNKVFTKIQNFVNYKYHKLVICQNLNSKNELIDKFPNLKRKIHQIYNPVQISDNYNIDENFFEFDMIAVGNLIWYKGYDRMIKIISLIDRSDIKLGIIGGGEQKELLKSQIKEFGLEDNITLLGVKRNPKKYMVKSKLLVHTAYFDNFPNVFLEAGSVGLPVIAFNAPGGISEIIINGINGYLVDDGDLIAMKNKILSSLNYKFDGNKIKNLIKQKFDQKLIIEKYEKIFRSL